MTDLFAQWAARWGVPLPAVAELRAMLIKPALSEGGETGIGEGGVTACLRLMAPAAGFTLFRNNVGVCQDATGRAIRYGLANESRQMNELLKSSDLIGWRTVRIEPTHVGRDLAVFTALEVKRAGWHYTGTPREVAQKRFLDTVAAHGGIASFSTGGLPDE